VTARRGGSEYTPRYIAVELRNLARIWEDEVEGVTVTPTEFVAGYWAPEVRAAMVKLRRFQRFVEAMDRSVTVTGDGRACAYCGGMIPEETPKATYCCPAHKQRAYEARQAARES
jgi:hypothetical protein